MAEKFEVIIGAVDNASPVLQKFQSNLQTTKTATDQVTDSLVGLGNQSRLAFAGLSIAVAGTTKVFTDFEDAMAKVATQLPGEQIEHFGELEQAVQELSQEYGQSTATMAQGLYDILSAAIPVEQSVKLLTQSAETAAAGFTDVATTTDLFTSILNAYGMEVDDAARVSDVLFQSVFRGKMEFADLAKEMGPIMGIAAQSGVGLEDLGAAMATLTRQGIPASEAATGVRQAILSFIDPTTEASAEAKAMGFELNASALQSKGLINAILELEGATSEEVAALFGNVRALMAVQGVLSDASGATEDLRLNYEALGTTQEAYEKATGTLKFELDQLKTSAQVLTQEFGEAMAPSLSNITDTMKNFIERIQDMPEPMKEFISNMTLTGVAVTGTLSGLGMLTKVLQGIMPIFGLTASAAGPVALALGAIAAATAAVIYYWPQLVEWWKKIEETNPLIKEAADAIRDLRNAMQEASEYAKSDMEERGGSFLMVWLAGKGAEQQTFITKITEMVGGAFKAMRDKIKEEEATTTETLSFMDRMGIFWDNFTAKVKDTQVWKDLSIIWTDLRDDCSTVFGAIGDSISESFDTAIKKVTGWLQGLWDFIKSIGDFFKNVFTLEADTIDFSFLESQIQTSFAALGTSAVQVFMESYSNEFNALAPDLQLSLFETFEQILGPGGFQEALDLWGTEALNAWAQGFGGSPELIQEAIDKGLIRPITDLLEAHSSPKALPQLETWGYKAGMAWGAALGLGASDAMAEASETLVKELEAHLGKVIGAQTQANMDIIALQREKNSRLAELEREYFERTGSGLEILVQKYREKYAEILSSFQWTQDEIRRIQEIANDDLVNQLTAYVEKYIEEMQRAGASSSEITNAVEGIILALEKMGVSAEVIRQLREEWELMPAAIEESKDQIDELIDLIGAVGDVVIDLEFGEKPTAGTVGGLIGGILGLFSGIPTWIAGIVDMVFGWIDQIQKRTQEMIDSVTSQFQSAMVDFFMEPDLDTAMRDFGQRLNEIVYKMMVDAIVAALIASEVVQDAAKKLGQAINEYMKGGTLDGLTAAMDEFIATFQNYVLPIMAEIYPVIQQYNPNDVVTGGTQTFGGSVPSYQTGGYVPKTGLALLHEGEYVMPKEGAKGVSFGNVEININTTGGVDGADLWDEFEREARRRGVSLVS